MLRIDERSCIYDLQYLASIFNLELCVANHFITYLPTNTLSPCNTQLQN